MNELVAKADIEKYSMQILRGSKSLDVFPTPVDQIVDYAGLVIKGSVDLSKVHASYVDRANEFLKGALAKVRGIFDFKEKVILLDLSQPPNRKNFIKLHETAHGILPWQSSVHQIVGDNDRTLSLDQKEEFEAEANYFASITLFQHDRFLHELSKLGLGIDSAMHLANHFGASVHASLRRYVDCSKNRCALLVLEDPKVIARTCCVRTFVASQRFVEEFPEFDMPGLVDTSYPFVTDYLVGRRFKKDGHLVCSFGATQLKFSYQFFNNSYNAFVLLSRSGK
jgi:hypothetical protein